MNPTLLLLIGIIIVIGIVIVVAGVVTIRSRRSLVDERLGQIFEEPSKPVKQQGEKKSILTEWIGSQVERTSFGERIKKELAQADLKLKPGEYVALLIIASGFLGFIGYYFGGGIIAGLVGVIVGPFLPRMYVSSQKKNRVSKFNDQLPDMLSLMVNGLRAGYSPMQAMEAVSKELPVPICDEFRRVVREMQLGLPMGDALDNLLRRIPSEDLDFIITAMNVQREVGGDLSEILDIIAFTIRERIRIKREIETLVAQVLYSGRILSLLPIALSLFLWFANRSYMEQFFLPQNRLCGIPILITGGLMIVAGYFAMGKVADIEL